MGASAGAVLVSTMAGFLLGATTTWLWQRGIQFQSRRRKGCQRDDEDEYNDIINNNLDEQKPAPRRYGGAIQLSPEKYQRYRELHDNVWDQVLKRMYKSNIRNFVIYYHKETSTLYQSFEWIGHWKQWTHGSTWMADETSLFQRDMAAIASDPITRSWWQECEPCQMPFAQWPSDGIPPSQGGTGDWWAPLECVCHTGHWPTAYSVQRSDPDFVKLAVEK